MILMRGGSQHKTRNNFSQRFPGLKNLNEVGSIYYLFNVFCMCFTNIAHTYKTLAQLQEIIIQCSNLNLYNRIRSCLLLYTQCFTTPCHEYLENTYFFLYDYYQWAIDRPTNVQFFLFLGYAIFVYIYYIVLNTFITCWQRKKFK